MSPIRFIGRCFFLLLALSLMAKLGVAQPSLAEAEAEPQAKAGPPVVELLNAGQEPRKPIRFRPAKGDSRLMVMTMDMQQQMQIGGAPLPAMPLPGQEITIKFIVTDVASNGDVSVAYEYTDWKVVRGGGVIEQVAAAIEQSVKPMVGTKGTLVTTSRGLPKGGLIETPEGVAPQLKAMVNGTQDSMKQIAAPAPEEPVGVGAEWRVTNRASLNGMVIKQSSLFKLLEIEGDAYKLQVKLTQDADEQKVDSPMMPPGAELTLISLLSEGTGESLLSMGSVIPQRVQLKMKTASDMKVLVAGQEQAMTMNMTLKMGMAPADRKGAEGKSPGE